MTMRKPRPRVVVVVKEGIVCDVFSDIKIDAFVLDYCPCGGIRAPHEDEYIEAKLGKKKVDAAIKEWDESAEESVILATEEPDGPMGNRER